MTGRDRRATMSPMSPADPPEPTGPETLPLISRHAATIELERAERALADLRWLGQVMPSGDEGGTRSVRTDLELPILDGSSPGPIRKSAILDIGTPRRAGEAVVVEIGWRSATLAPLFPVFSGRLVVRPAGLELDGRYAPPFGRVGLLLDRSLLHLVAGRTAAALLARFSTRLTSPEA
jgi:hypothetical protein